MSFMFAGQDMFIYAFGFYTANPETLSCHSPEGLIDITVDEACANDIIFTDCTAPESKEYSENFQNWIVKQKMWCKDQKNNNYFISLFGTSMMFGLTIGALTLTNLSDIFGRKAVLSSSIILATGVTIAIIMF
jgi:MFS family permease